MHNIAYYMKCLNAPSLLASLKILLDSLWESGEDKSSDAGSIMQQVEQIHKYIERSYHENITLTALAEQYHMDASYLSRTFSQKYGETIISYQNSDGESGRAYERSGQEAGDDFVSGGI